MGFHSFAVIAEALRVIRDNRRAILGVATFPLCVIIVLGLLRFSPPGVLGVSELLTALALVPYKIDLLRLYLIGEPPRGRHPSRLFERLEIRFFLYEMALILFAQTLFMISTAIADRAGESWEQLSAALKTGSVASILVLFFFGMYYGLPALLYFPGLSLGFSPKIKEFYARAGKHRLKVFFAVFWASAIFMPFMALVMAVPGADKAGGAGAVAGIAATLANSVLVLANDTLGTVVVAVIFKKTLMQFGPDGSVDPDGQDKPQP